MEGVGPDDLQPVLLEPQVGEGGGELGGHLVQPLDLVTTKLSGR